MAGRRGTLWVFLRPGLGIKRWLIAFVVGIGALGLGTAFLVSLPVTPIVLPLLRNLTLSSYSGPVRGAMFLSIGFVVAFIALYNLYRSVVIGASGGRAGVSVISSLYDQRFRSRGPRIVAVGGGTGLATLLSGLKSMTDNLTAVVTIADDGGSSGRLRTELGIPPPGDARNCIVALSVYESLMEDLFDYRFTSKGELTGHSLGNLLLAALHDTQGGFEPALNAAASILGLSGKVVPVSSNENLTLRATTSTGEVLTGESVIGASGANVERLEIIPEDAYVSESAVEAIAMADLVVVGPGSLYTSILPNLLVMGMKETLQACPAPVVFVCNVASQPEETDYVDPEDYLSAVYRHSGVSFTHVLMNSVLPSVENGEAYEFVRPKPEIAGFTGQTLVHDLIDDSNTVRHDPKKLADSISRILKTASK